MSNWTPPQIVAQRIDQGKIGAADPTNEAAVALFARIGIEQVVQVPAKAWVLQQTHQRLELMRADGVTLSVDFIQGKARHRSQEAGQGAQPLSKALGLRAYRRTHGHMPAVVDATGGLGQDAWAVASMGCHVTVIEQHPVVYALLEDALQRALLDEQGQQTASLINLVHADAVTALAQVAPHAIYLDPMYPERPRKKAESKKAMQFLHALLGPASTLGTQALLQSALARPVTRVVVKRPRGAEPIACSGSTAVQRTTIESPNTRYDVYFP